MLSEILEEHQMEKKRIYEVLLETLDPVSLKKSIDSRNEELEKVISEESDSKLGLDEHFRSVGELLKNAMHKVEHDVKATN